MRWIKLGLWVLFTFAIVALFVTINGQNQEPMTVTLFNVDTEAQPKWLILAICVLIGALLASTFFIVSLVILEVKYIRLSRANKKLIRALEKAGLSVKSTSSTNPGFDNREPLPVSGVSSILADDDSDV
jgi:uncharacterized membrane protein YciS (DUF1049 family)